MTWHSEQIYWQFCKNNKCLNCFSWHHSLENITSVPSKKGKIPGVVFLFFSFLVHISPWILLIELPKVIVITLTDVIYQHLPPPLTIPSAPNLVRKKYFSFPHLNLSWSFGIISVMLVSLVMSLSRNLLSSSVAAERSLWFSWETISIQVW